MFSFYLNNVIVNIFQTVQWFFSEIKQKMKNLHAVKSIVFSDMPSMSYFTENRASGKVNEKGGKQCEKDRQVEVPWSSWDWKMRGSQIFSLVCECTSGRAGCREGIYHKHSAASLIPLCIHGWSGRNTRGHFSHPVGSSNIHASHIVAVQVRRLMLLS